MKMTSSMKTDLIYPLTIILLTLGLLILSSDVIFAQPTLPTGPSQAPIDGGLGLVAAAGGAYAWKKLKNKQAQL